MLRRRISKYIFPKLIILSSLVFISTIALGKSEEDVIYIPVVFHIVYNLDEENISDEQIQSQLASLNSDFRARNVDVEDVVAEFESIIGDTQIEFVFADRITEFTVTSIQRIKTEEQVFFNSDLFHSSNGGSDPIEEGRILNVWVANLAEGLLGFYDSNGVAVDFKSFGTVGTATSPNNLGRTLTHELGHFFSLSHLWGLGGCDSDDGVEDTPVQSSEILNCTLDSNSCGSKDMTQNFMNTSSDDCLLFFTQGQVEKMRTHISDNLRQMVLAEEDIILSAGPKSKAINFYPNPSPDGIFYLEEKSSEKLLLEIFSLEGKLMDTYTISGGESIQLNDFDSGVYLVMINQKNVRTASKIIIE